jgi:hypothetical protein
VAEGAGRSLDEIEVMGRVDAQRRVLPAPLGS